MSKSTREVARALLALYDNEGGLTAAELGTHGALAYKLPGMDSKDWRPRWAERTELLDFPRPILRVTTNGTKNVYHLTPPARQWLKDHPEVLRVWREKLGTKVAVVMTTETELAALVAELLDSVVSEDSEQVVLRATATRDMIETWIGHLTRRGLSTIGGAGGGGGTGGGKVCGFEVLIVSQGWCSAVHCGRPRRVCRRRCRSETCRPRESSRRTAPPA